MMTLFPLFKRLLFLIAIFNTYFFTAQAQDTIKVGENRLLTKFCKPGVRQYLVYTQLPGEKKRLNLSLWRRETKRSVRHGEPIFIISQSWYTGDSSRFRSVYSINRQIDFSPIFHRETIGNSTKAYNWSDQKVTGADSVINNKDEAFNLIQQYPSFNWNLDIETFEQLPLAKGKVFSINFYDAGKNPPRVVIYRVAGTALITLLNGRKINCWKLVTKREGKDGSSSQIFYISKKGHEFIKEEDDFNGTRRVKIRLPVNED